MTNGSELRQLLYLCLILTFVMTGCSNDNQSTEGNASEEKQSVTKQTTTKDKNAQSLYAQSIRKIGRTKQEGYKGDYTKALVALDKENYDMAQSLLTEAVAIHNDAWLTTPVPGIRVRSYIPHYHLGMIAYLNGDCATALDHWKTSLSQKVIQQVPEYRSLQEALPVCVLEDR